MNVRLIKLTKQYYNQLSEMIDEWKLDQQINHTNHSPWAIFKNDYHDFDNYLLNLELKEPKDGLVPDSTFFLLEEDRDILLGAVNIRHYLNDYLLQYGGHIGDGIRPSQRGKGYGTKIVNLALLECRKLGIPKVLMVCDKSNVASAKTIINNGGILENEYLDEKGVIQQRYWITVDKELIRKELKCDIHPLNSLNNYKYTVICSYYNNMWVLSKHKKRDTYETQGGRIEAEETPIEAAKRELYEESGISDAVIYPVCDYVGYNHIGSANGQVFLAVVNSINELPESEMSEIKLFETLPSNLTYPDVSPLLYKEAYKLYLNLYNNDLFHYSNNSDIISAKLVEDDITYSVLNKILQFNCKDIYTNRNSVIICYSNPPYPIWVWCKDVNNSVDVKSIAYCLKYNYLLKGKYNIILIEELLIKLIEMDNLFETLRTKMELFSYQLNKINEINYPIDGYIRLANYDDLDVLTTITKDSYYEMEGFNFTLEESKNKVINLIEQSSLYVWVNKENEIVSTVSASSSNRYAKIASVYTLPKYRRKGYAINLVYSITKSLLADNLIPTLYTDGSYLASNECYKKIGYEQVGKLVNVEKN